jgi:hypothetical protein
VWDLANPRKAVLKQPDFDADPDALTWLNGQTVAAVTADDTYLDVWHVRDGRLTSPLATVPIGTQSSPTLQASSDAGLIVAGYNNVNGGQDTLELWSVTDDQRGLAELAEMPGDSVYVAFAPDGQTLATRLFPEFGQQFAFAGSDYATVLYSTAPDAVYSQLCRVTSGVDVSNGWRRYLPATYYRAPC